MLSPRERHQCVLLGQTPDRVDVTAAIGLRSGPQGGWKRRLSARGLCLTNIVSPYRPYFRFPGCTNPYLAEVVYTETTYCDQGTWTVRHTLETPAGKLEAVACRNLELGVGDSPREHFVKEPADWRVVNDLFRRLLARMEPNYDEMWRDQEGFGDRGYTQAVVARTPFQLAWIELASLERLAVDCHERSEGWLEFVEIQRQYHRRAAELAAGCPSDHILLIDNITNTISPRLYREYCIPFYQIYADAFRGTDKILVVHHDGLLAHLKREIAAAPFRVVDSFTVPPSGNVSLVEAKALWPDKQLFVNLPPHLAYETPEALRQAYGQIAAEWGSRLLVIEHVEDFPLEQVEAHLSAALDACGY